MAEEHYHDHGQETGHSYKAVVPEQPFLSEISRGDKIKRALYADLLSLVEHKMKLLLVSEKDMKCKDCGKEIFMKHIRLNDDGVEFTGFLDLIEYILLKYKFSWTLIVAPIVTFILGGYIKDLIELWNNSF